MHDPAYAVGLLVLLLLAVGWWLASTRVSRGNASRNRRAQAAEHHAERLLVRHGFRIVDRQLTGAVQLRVDGVTLEGSCRADLLVKRRRRHYIAEVKSGTTVTDPTHPSTRRQLLEYRLVFDVDGVLLVDMHRERIVEVEFPAL